MRNSEKQRLSASTKQQWAVLDSVERGRRTDLAKYWLKIATEKRKENGKVRRAAKPARVFDNPVECKICKKICEANHGLGIHLRHEHKITPQQYYDQFIRKEKEGFCHECNKQTRFTSLTEGYVKHCSPECGYQSKERSRAISVSHLGKQQIKKRKPMSDEQRQECSRRRIKVILEGRANHKTGVFFSKKNNEEVGYRSSYELAAYQILEQLTTVKNYKVESVCIPYIYKGAIKRYVPDIVVENVDGSVDVIEVKPDIMTNESMNQAKFEAAEKWCAERRFTFRVWTEKNEPRLLQNVVTA